MNLAFPLHCKRLPPLKKQTSRQGRGINGRRRQMHRAAHVEAEAASACGYKSLQVGDPVVHAEPGRGADLQNL
jgi:hypothetical protein